MNGRIDDKCTRGTGTGGWWVLRREKDRLGNNHNQADHAPSSLAVPRFAPSCHHPSTILRTCQQQQQQPLMRRALCNAHECHYGTLIRITRGHGVFQRVARESACVGSVCLGSLLCLRYHVLLRKHTRTKSERRCHPTRPFRSFAPPAKVIAARMTKETSPGQHKVKDCLRNKVSCAAEYKQGLVGFGFFLHAGGTKKRT